MPLNGKFSNKVQQSLHGALQSGARKDAISETVFTRLNALEAKALKLLERH